VLQQQLPLRPETPVAWDRYRRGPGY
jgi:hypothetical protein